MQYCYIEFGGGIEGGTANGGGMSGGPRVAAGCLGGSIVGGRRTALPLLNSSI